MNFKAQIYVYNYCLNKNRNLNLKKKFVCFKKVNLKNNNKISTDKIYLKLQNMKKIVLSLKHTF